MNTNSSDSSVKVSVQLTRRQRILGTLALVTWGGALVMALLLIWRVERLKTHMEEMNVRSGEMVKSAEELRQSTERLDESVHRFVEQYKAQQQAAQAAGASSAR